MNQSTTQKAVIYVRVSSIAQTIRGSGLRSQEVRCREFADLKGYEVVDVYTDKETGGKRDREGITAMLKFLKKACRKEPHIVLIDDLNRMARDVRVHFDLRDAINDAGAKLESPTWEFGENSDAIYMETVIAAGAQYQKHKNTEQAKSRMRARAMDGYYPFRRL